MKSSEEILREVGGGVISKSVAIKAMDQRTSEIVEIVRKGFNGQVILLELMQNGAIKNEDGMPVIEYVDKPNGGNVAYVRYDAMVKRLNTLVKELEKLLITLNKNGNRY